MKELFVTYSQAKELKELGFDEPCLALWHTDELFSLTGCESHNQYYGQECSAPLKQQVFRWCREKHNLPHQICGTSKPNLYHAGYLDGDTWKLITEEGSSFAKYFTYEQAESECIDKLISLIKNK